MLKATKESKQRTSWTRPHAAYDDAEGVTAAFNLNVLRRFNSEMGASFELRSRTRQPSS